MSSAKSECNVTASGKIISHEDRATEPSAHQSSVLVAEALKKNLINYDWPCSKRIAQRVTY